MADLSPDKSRGLDEPSPLAMEHIKNGGDAILARYLIGQLRADPRDEGFLAEVIKRIRQTTPSHAREKDCQSGVADVCKAAQKDGVVCPAESCDIDDGTRTVLVVDDDRSIASAAMVALAEETFHNSVDDRETVRRASVPSTTPQKPGEPQESPLAWAVFVHLDPQGYDYRIFPDEQEADDVAGENPENGEPVPLYRASAFVPPATPRSAANSCPACGADLCGRPEWAVNEARHNLDVLSIIEEVEANRRGAAVTHVVDPLPGLKQRLGERESLENTLRLLLRAADGGKHG